MKKTPTLSRHESGLGVESVMTMDFELDWIVVPEQVQGGSAWHEMRQKMIGASDAPVIMGVSPWKTPYRLWLEKTGQVQPEKVSNYATERGHKLEPIARARFEKLHNMRMPPKVFTKDDLIASMDGFNEPANMGLEIKCPGYKDHLEAMGGTIPEKYHWQLVHQFVVTGAEKIVYFSYYVEKDQDHFSGTYEQITALRNEVDEKRYLEELERFRRCVREKEPPPMTEKDYLPVTDEPALELSRRYVDLMHEFNIAKQKLDLVKDQLIELAKSKDHERVRIGKASIVKVTRKGSIDMDAVIDSHKIRDAESFRKPDVVFYKVELERGA